MELDNLVLEFNPGIFSLGTIKSVAMKTINGSPLSISSSDEMSSDEIVLMQNCLDAYFNDEIVGGAIEIAVGLSISDYTLTQVDEQNADLYKWYIDEILDIDSFLEDVFWGLLVTNNVYLQRILGVEEVPNDIKIKNSKAIVGRYQNINPLSVIIEGALNEPDKLTYIVTTEGDDAEEETLKAEEIIHISDKRPYQRYGIPMLKRALPALLRKTKMNQADVATLNGIIHQIVLITLASPEEGELEDISSKLTNIARAMTIVYDDRLKVEFKHPDTNILNPTKYNDVNDTIANATGVNFGFTNKETSYASGTIDLRLLIKRLTRLRKIVAKVITKELRRFATAVGLKDRVLFKFKPFDLENEKYIGSVLLPLRREGLLSATTALNSANFNPDYEFKQLQEELALQKKGLLLPFNNSPRAGRPAGTTSQNDYPEERNEITDSPTGNQ